MSGHKLEKSESGGKTIFKLSGSINEDSKFDEGDFVGLKEVILDLNEIIEINSCGVREWTKWISYAVHLTSLSYINCPKVIVNQINMVTGFLPKNATVDSLYVPYYCASSGNEKMILFSRGREFTDTELNPPSIIDDASGEEMEMDIYEEKYFRFLRP